MTPETPTPRTDAQPWINRYPEYHEGATRWVTADFARQLERELAAKDAHADEIYKASVDLAAKLEADLATERALADRLGRWMEDHRKNWQWHKVDESCGCEDCVFLVPFDEALAAWRECRK